MALHFQALGKQSSTGPIVLGGMITHLAMSVENFVQPETGHVEGGNAMTLLYMERQGWIRPLNHSLVPGEIQWMFNGRPLFTLPNTTLTAFIPDQASYLYDIPAEHVPVQQPIHEQAYFRDAARAAGQPGEPGPLDPEIIYARFRQLEVNQEALTSHFNQFQSQLWGRFDRLESHFERRIAHKGDDYESPISKNEVEFYSPIREERKETELVEITSTPKRKHVARKSGGVKGKEVRGKKNVKVQKNIKRKKLLFQDDVGEFGSSSSEYSDLDVEWVHGEEELNLNYDDDDQFFLQTNGKKTSAANILKEVQVSFGDGEQANTSESPNSNTETVLDFAEKDITLPDVAEELVGDAAGPSIQTCSQGPRSNASTTTALPAKRQKHNQAQHQPIQQQQQPLREKLPTRKTKNLNSM
ncbi:hypothetical protein SOVF_205860 [Spinacia oleracea]|nr:hypothetical protein SOVF_205860 [Spinacia oleracea]